MPRDPGPCRWQLPDPALAPPGEELIATGADLSAATLLAGYRRGLFGMPHRRRLLWLSPDPRGVLPLSGVHVARSLRRSSRDFGVSVDQAFAEVLAGCAAPGRPGGRWITAAYARTYRQLHEMGWAHSIEVWRNGELAGGLFGVELGGLFCGESMFHRVTDASKTAVWATRTLLARGEALGRIFDVQWLTPHLASLGGIDVPRAVYLAALPAALALPAVLIAMPPVAAASLLAARPATG